MEQMVVGVARPTQRGCRKASGLQF